MKVFSLLATLVFWSLYTQATYGQHVDVLIARQGERLVTGSFDFGTIEANIPVRVFTRAFEFVVSKKQ